jgi:hypothetical protein
LIKWLSGYAIARVVYEPTGACHCGFERRFLEAGFHLAKVNPRHARRFAEAVFLCHQCCGYDWRNRHRPSYAPFRRIAKLRMALGCTGLRPFEELSAAR